MQITMPSDWRPQSRGAISLLPPRCPFNWLSMNRPAQLQLAGQLAEDHLLLQVSVMLEGHLDCAACHSPVRAGAE